MRRTAACILVLAIVLWALPRPPSFHAGVLRVGAINADLMTTNHGECDCCAPLWGGGIATTTADLSSVQVDDTATIQLLDSSRLVLECVEIIPCIKTGGLLIGRHGVIRANGDVIIHSNNKAYRFVRL